MPPGEEQGFGVAELALPVESTDAEAFADDCDLAEGGGDGDEGAAEAGWCVPRGSNPFRYSYGYHGQPEFRGERFGGDDQGTRRLLTLLLVTAATMPRRR